MKICRATIAARGERHPAGRRLGFAPIWLSAAAALMLCGCSSGEMGSVTLRWTAPTENEDGSELDDLAGYRVYWRQAEGPVERMVVIDDPSETSYEIEELADGEWLAGVTAFTESALESDLATVSFTIRDGEADLDESTVGRIETREEFVEPEAVSAAAAEARRASDGAEENGR